MALPQTAFEELGLEVLAHLLQPPPPIQWRTLKEHCGGVMGNGGGACTHIQVKCTMGERERDFGRSSLAKRSPSLKQGPLITLLFVFFFFSFFNTVQVNTTHVGHGTRLTQP